VRLDQVIPIAAVRTIALGAVNASSGRLSSAFREAFGLSIEQGNLVDQIIEEYANKLRTFEKKYRRLEKNGDEEYYIIPPFGEGQDLAQELVQRVSAVVPENSNAGRHLGAILANCPNVGSFGAYEETISITAFHGVQGGHAIERVVRDSGGKEILNWQAEINSGPLQRTYRGFFDEN
jgi:hypothetical protein